MADPLTPTTWTATIDREDTGEPHVRATGATPEEAVRNLEVATAAAPGWHPGGPLRIWVGADGRRYVTDDTPALLGRVWDDATGEWTDDEMGEYDAHERDRIEAEYRLALDDARREREAAALAAGTGDLVDTDATPGADDEIPF